MTSSEELGELMVAAYSYQKQGKYSSAIKNWNSLVNNRSADNDLKASAHINLGHLHQQQGNLIWHMKAWLAQLRRILIALKLIIA